MHFCGALERETGSDWQKFSEILKKVSTRLPLHTKNWATSWRLSTFFVFVCKCAMWVYVLIHMCDMTQSFVWLDSFIYMTWLIHMCEMTHSYYFFFFCVQVCYVGLENEMLIRVHVDANSGELSKDFRARPLGVYLWNCIYICNIYAVFFNMQFFLICICV